MKRKITNFIYPIIALVIIVSIWWIVASSIGLDIILPTPATTLSELLTILGEVNFYTALLGTFVRAMIGFAISFIAASIIAGLSSTSQTMRKIVEPIIVILRSTPTMSIILIAVIWLGSEESTILIGILIVFPIMYSQFLAAVMGVDYKLVEMSKAYGVGRKDRITKLYIPLALPNIFATLRTTISLNIKVVIAAEVIAQTSSSLGLLMNLARIRLETASLLAYTIAAIVLSYILELAVEGVGKLLIKGQVKYENQ